MKYGFDRFFKFKINDDEWEMYLVTEEEYIELDNEDDDGKEEAQGAMVKLDEKCLFVCEGNVNKGIITHELFHIYVDSFHLDSAEIDVDSFEEIVASFLQYQLDKFIKKRNQIYKQFIKLEEFGRNNPKRTRS